MRPCWKGCVYGGCRKYPGRAAAGNPGTAQLAESQETLRAIREGEVDALVVSTPEGNRIFTLQGADQTYRTIIEQMQEGAVTLVADGRISYSNRHFAEMVKRPLEEIIGSHVREYVVESDQDGLQQLIRQTLGGSARGEVTLQVKTERWSPSKSA